MNGTVHGPAAAARPRGAAAGHLMTGVVLPVVTAAGRARRAAGAGARRPVLAGWGGGRRGARLGPGRGRLRPGTRAGAAVADGGRDPGRRRRADRGPARQPAPGGPAPAGPGGRDRWRRRWSSRLPATSCSPCPTASSAGGPGVPAPPSRYLGALGTGLVFALAGRPLPPLVAALGLVAAVGCALPAVRVRYLHATAAGRERLQWLAIGVVVAVDAVVIIVVLHLLVGWPTAVAAAAAGVTVAIPLSLIAGGIPRLAPHGGRLLVHVLWVAGFSLVVAAVYVVIVLGLGKGPADAGDREILGLSMLAAAVAAAGYLPSRDRLLASATRFVYGAREAPDEVLRTFGSRMTRAVAMDELLLQLAESLRKTMGLTRAEVYTGGGEVLERAVSVPDAGRRTILISERERPVVTRAGVSGNAWASIWLPALLDGRERSQLRVAPISHGGELLGLIVVERPAGRTPSPRRTTAC